MEESKTLRTVLITGASSGIGRDCTILLSREKYLVFAGLHNEKDLKWDLFQESKNIIPILLDVTNPAQISSAFKKVYRYTRKHGLFGIINNAGTAVSGPLELLSIEVIKQQFEVNFFGYLRVIQKFIPLVRQAHGRIINIGSISGRISGPFLGPYSATKFAIRAVTDSLRRELNPWKIPVILIEPGRVTTPIWQKAKVHSDKILLKSKKYNEYYSEIFEKILIRRQSKGNRGIVPLAVAKIIKKALEDKSPKTRYYAGVDALLLSIAYRILPDKFIDKVIFSQLGMN